MSRRNATVVAARKAELLRRAKTKREAQAGADRAIAAGEVLEAVWLHDFELEHKIDKLPIVEYDPEGNPWVTVKIQVPQLDVDAWLDGTHSDHPNNKSDPDDEES